MLLDTSHVVVVVVVIWMDPLLLLVAGVVLLLLGFQYSTCISSIAKCSIIIGLYMVIHNGIINIGKYWFDDNDDDENELDCWSL
jgi:membrane protein YdbS with pleckstrin-like domain